MAPLRLAHSYSPPVPGGGGVAQSLVRLPDPSYYRRSVYPAMDNSGRLVVFGENWLPDGSNQYAGHSQPERYDPTTRTWTVLANPPKFLYQSAWTWDASYRYIGVGSINLDLNTLTATGPPESFMYDPSSDTWTTLANSPDYGGPTGQGVADVGWRSLSGVNYALNQHQDPITFVTTEYMMHFTGGASGTWVQNSSPPGGFISNMEYLVGSGYGSGGVVDPITGVFYIGTPIGGYGMPTYNPATDTWGFCNTPPSNMPILNRFYDGGNHIYFLGSPIVSLSSASNQFWRYNMTTNAYQQLGNFPVSISGVYAPMATANYVAFCGYRIGGAGATFNTHIWRYSFLTSTWHDTGLIPAFTRDGVQRAPTPVKDTVGPGWYLVQGSPVSTAYEGSLPVEYLTL